MYCRNVSNELYNCESKMYDSLSIYSFLGVVLVVVSFVFCLSVLILLMDVSVQVLQAAGYRSVTKDSNWPIDLILLHQHWTPSQPTLNRD